MAYTTPETSLAEDCLKYLKDLIDNGAPIYLEHRSGSGGFNYKKGVPDLFVVINGIHIELELKAPNGHLSTMQEKFQWRCKSQWHILHFVPRTFEEFKEIIERYLPQKETTDTDNQ